MSSWFPCTGQHAGHDLQYEITLVKNKVLLKLFKTAVNTLKPNINTAACLKSKSSCCDTSMQDQKKRKLQHHKDLLQIFVSKISYFKSHVFSTLFFLKCSTVFDIRATRTQTIFLPGGKRWCFLSHLLSGPHFSLFRPGLPSNIKHST